MSERRWSMEEKLRALEYCISNEHHEDACAHLCDLLWHEGRKIKPSHGRPFWSLRAIVAYYGEHLTEIDETGQPE